uniref:Uncharacterized protein n=1 Tax=Solibacter usitatus (strain Ellin6076) TaxID=234267 RepID=Q028D7_SOLUE
MLLWAINVERVPVSPIVRLLSLIRYVLLPLDGKLRGRTTGQAFRDLQAGEQYFVSNEPPCQAIIGAAFRRSISTCASWAKKVSSGA